MDTQEIEKIDAKLREVFRRNAPPSDERRLAVALQPDALGKSAYHPGRTSQRQRPRWTVRTAVIVAAVLVLAVGVGMGVWKIVGMMGQGDPIIMITDTPMSPTTGASAVSAPGREGAGGKGLVETVTDGTWELRVDRQARLSDVQLPTDELPETAYVPMENPPVWRVLISEDGARISVEANPADLGAPADPAEAADEVAPADPLGATGAAASQTAIPGRRTSSDGDRLWYDLDTFTGGRFVIWQTPEGLQAEMTLYGSGLPIISSVRGRLVEIGPAEAHADEGPLFPVEVDGRLGFINVHGQMVIPAQFEPDPFSVFSEGLAPVRTGMGEKVGYIDTTGAMVIRPQFDLADAFSEGLAPVAGANGLWGFIDKTGVFALPARYDLKPGPFTDGLSAVLIDERLKGGELRGAYIDKTGAVVIGPSEWLAGFSEGLAMVGAPRDGVVKWGYMDTSGAMVIEPQFAFAQEFSEELAAVGFPYGESGAKWGIIDKTGAWWLSPSSTASICSPRGSLPCWSTRRPAPTSAT